MTHGIPKMEQQRIDSRLMMDRAKQHVLTFVKDYYGPNAYAGLTTEDVYVVWFCKALQNWKALLTTTIRDGFYYEVTYNGNKREAYIDAYKKQANVVIPDPEDSSVLDTNDPFGYAVRPTSTHPGLLPHEYNQRFDNVMNGDQDGQ